MRWRTQSLIAIGLMVSTAAPAFACGFWFNSAFMGVPGGPTISVALQNWFTDYTQRSLTGDAAFKVGDKAAVRAGAGICMEEAGDDTESNILFGASGSMKVWQDEAGKMSVNAQAGLEMVSYDGGSYRNIPIGVAVMTKSSETMSLYGGAALNLMNYSADDCPDGFDCDASNSDPTLFGGAVFAMGKINLTAGATIYMGDETDFALNVAGSMAMGSTMSGLRKIGSLFRK